MPPRNGTVPKNAVCYCDSDGQLIRFRYRDFRVVISFDERIRDNALIENAVTSQTATSTCPISRLLAQNPVLGAYERLSVLAFVQLKCARLYCSAFRPRTGSGAFASRETEDLPGGKCKPSAKADPERPACIHMFSAGEEEPVFGRQTAEVRLAASRGGRIYFPTGVATSSSVTTKKWRRSACPNEVVIATSAASRPVAISTRPILDWLFRASKVHQRPSK
jgi:hypothetical protein